MDIDKISEQINYMRELQAAGQDERALLSDIDKEKAILGTLVKVQRHLVNRDGTGYLVGMSKADYQEWQKFKEFTEFQTKKDG